MHAAADLIKSQNVFFSQGLFCCNSQFSGDFLFFYFKKFMLLELILNIFLERGYSELRTKFVFLFELFVIPT